MHSDWKFNPTLASPLSFLFKPHRRSHILDVGLRLERRHLLNDSPSVRSARLISPLLRNTCGASSLFALGNPTQNRVGHALTHCGHFMRRDIVRFFSHKNCNKNLKKPKNEGRESTTAVPKCVFTGMNSPSVHQHLEYQEAPMNPGKIMRKKAFRHFKMSRQKALCRVTNDCIHRVIEAFQNSGKND